MAEPSSRGDTRVDLEKVRANKIYQVTVRQIVKLVADGRLTKDGLMKVDSTTTRQRVEEGGETK